MSAYLVIIDNEEYVVEADSINDAVRIAVDQLDPAIDELMVSLISDSEVLREE